MAFNPYSQPAPAPTAPAMPSAYDLSPEDLDAFLAAGGQIAEDGSLIPPMMGGNGIPNAGSLTAMGNAPAYQPGTGMSPLATPPPPSAFDNPIFGAHMAIRNPQETPPNIIDQMLKAQRRFMKGDQGPKGPNVNVPGGASIVGGNPTAAPLPTPTDYGMGPTGPSNPYGGRIGRRMASRGQGRPVTTTRGR